LLYSPLSSNCRGDLLREWRKWFIVVLSLVFPFFFIGGSDYYDPRSLKELWNLGHFFFFALLVLVLDSHLCSTGRSVFFRIFAAFLASVVVGLSIELIQLNIDGRFFSWFDVVTDLSGGASALLWKTGRKFPGFRSILRGFVLILIVLVNLVPVATALTDEYRSYKDFPLLAGFESEAELSRWAGGRVGLSRVSSPRLQGRYSAKMILTTDEYSGVSLQYFPSDWSGRKGLAFNVFNSGQPISLHYRVHDYLHQHNAQLYDDRFNGKTLLEYGWNEIVIPLTDIIEAPQGREMDVKKIRGFGIFVMKQTQPHILFLDNVRLL
jgi:VanZ family protein